MSRSLNVKPAAVPPPPPSLVAVDRAAAELRRGGLVLVSNGGSGGVLVQAAEAVTAEALARFAAVAGRAGELAVTARRAAVLKLVPPGERVVTLARDGGLKAAQIRDLADPCAGGALAAPPGLSVAPAAPDSAVAAAVALCKLARLLPAALVAPVEGEAAAFAARHDVMAVAAADIEHYQQTAARTLRPVGDARVPLEGAENARVVAFRPADGGVEHLAIVIGEPDADAPVLTRLHSECFTGDLLGSLRCDCGDQLRGAIAEIAQHGSGVLLYLAQEGRGIGLVNKLRAYRLQDQGFDTIDANEQLGFDDDERIYLPAAEMLRLLGVHRVRLMTNNPGKVQALARHDIEVVERVPHVFPANDHNELYLRTKANRSGHLF